MAVTNLKRVQFGQEVTWGTGVAATALLMGVTESSLDIPDEVLQVEEQGSLAPSDLVAEVKQSAAATVDFNLSYEDILFLLDGIFGDCTPTGTDPYTWAYGAPGSAVVAPREYTMEFGMADAEYEMVGAIFNDCGISGDIDGDGVWQASCNLLGQKADPQAMTSLSRRVVELIRMVDTLLYIDAKAGTIGATEVSSALISFDLSIDPKYHLKYFGGSLNPGGFGHDRWEGQLTVVAEFTTAVKAYIASLLTPGLVEKQIRLEATSGTKSAILDFAGYLVDGASLFDDRDGNATISLTFQGEYNATMGNWLDAEIINGVATLP